MLNRNKEEKGTIGEGRNDWERREREKGFT